MNAGPSLLVALAAASLLSGCAAAQPPRSTSTAGDAPTTSGRAPTGLAYSAASAHAVQTMPAPGSCHYRGSGLYTQPDPRCSPGALNPAVTQANIEQTICRPGGYTASVRPPETVTEPEKRALMAAYDNRGDPVGRRTGSHRQPWRRRSGERSEEPVSGARLSARLPHQLLPEPQGPPRGSTAPTRVCRAALADPSAGGARQRLAGGVQTVRAVSATVTIRERALGAQDAAEK